MHRNRPFATLLLLCLCLRASAQPGGDSITDPWSQVPAILNRIVPPQFPARDFVITDFGAVPDGRTDCTAAIARAIAVCADSGGGRVVIPAGTFLTGPIHLRSGIDLHLAATNSLLLFRTDPAAYLPPVFTRFEGTELYNLSPLIYALDCHDLALTGPGTLDAQADATNWFAWSKAPARARLLRMAEANVPVEQRQFGPADHLRPGFIEFNRCGNILIDGPRIRRSPMWEIHPLLCTNVTVRHVDIFSHGPNNDGCDPESSRDVLIEDCTFDTGDDCIAIKSGRNADGRRLHVPAANIIIRHCTMRDGHAGTAIGSEISGGCHDVFIEDCHMSSSSLVCALRLKSNAMRGGVLENIFMRQIDIGLVRDSVLQINFLYEEGARGPCQPVARNILLDHLTVARTPRVLNVRGFPAASITGIRITDSVFHQVQSPDVVIDADVRLLRCTLDPAP